MTSQELIAKLDEIPGNDPEVAHLRADTLLRAYLAEHNPAVDAAYRRVKGRCDWWAYA